MFSLFAPRDCNQAIAFLEHFRTSLYPWTLIATGGHGRTPVMTFTPQLHGAAGDWILKMQKQRRNVLLLMAETHGAVTGVKLMHGHLRGTRHFGVKLALTRAAELEAFKPAPFLRLEAGHKLFAAWRLLNEVPIERAEAVAADVAARLGGVSLGHMVPLPGIINESAKVELVHLIKDRLNVLTDFAVAPTETPQEATQAIFTAASNVKAEPETWLWPGVVPSGALTLLTGQPKAGKTQITLDAAARVSAGLAWPTGEPCAAGKVAVFELEDKAASSIVPRLMAMGADIGNIVIRDAKDGTLNLAEEFPRVAAELERAGGVKLLTLSPLLAFFGQQATDDAEVRRRLRPLLEWAANTGTAIIGVLHPPKRPGQNLEAQFAGADTYRRAARAAWVVAPDATDDEPDIKRKRRALMCAGINGAADDLRLFFRIKGATVDGIPTSRIEWHDIEDEPGACVSDRGKSRTQPDLRMGGETQSNVVNMPMKADAWLRQALANGPRDAGDLKAEAAAVGIHHNTLYRAGKRLGVEITGNGFGRARLWSMCAK